MRDIFKYPDEAATHYIDPNYVGDNTVGYKKRINEMLNGTMFNWNGALPTVDSDTFMETSSKYWYYYDTWFYPSNDVNNPTISFKNFTDKPALIASAGWETPQSVNQYSFFNDDFPGEVLPTRRYSVTAHGYNDGDRITLSETDNNDDWVIDGYVKKWNSFQFSICETPALNDPYVYPGDLVGDDVYSFCTREQNGTKVHYQQAHNLTNGTYIKLSNNFTEAHDTGTANSKTTQFTAGVYGGNFSFRLYDTVGTDMTLTENYHGELTLHFENTTGSDVVYQLKDIDISTHPAYAQIMAEGRMVCRVLANNIVGTFTPSYNSNHPINTSGSILYEYVDEFWYQPMVDDTVDIYDFRGPGTTTPVLADFKLTDGSSVDITIYFVNPARMGGGGFYKNTLAIQSPQLSSWYYNSVEHVGLVVEPKWTIQSVDLQVPGNQVFQYRDTNGDYQFGAELGQWYHKPGITSYFQHASIPAVSFTSVSGSNRRLASASLDLNELRTIDTDTTEAILSVYPLPNTYVPPAPTPSEIAGLEDIHNTSSAWDNLTGFAGSAKRWPDGFVGVYPRSVKVKENTPTVTNFSQNGRKYARSAGYTKWTMEVEYPPLTWDQFRYLHAAAQLARGQSAIFEFAIADEVDYSKWWPFQLNPSINSFPTVREWVSSRSVLVDGFPSNYANVGKAGQLVNVGSDRNGESASVLVNDVQANIYGEAVLTVAYDNFNWQTSTGNQIWMQPTFLAVSLNSDDFDWSVDENDNYRVSVSFVLDFYK